MNQSTFHTELFELMPVPIAITKSIENSTNAAIVYINQCFLDELGWDINDIPDKNTWWTKAYPDEDYRKVVERQWELVSSNAADNNEKTVSIVVNIVTKYGDITRYKVSTLLDDYLNEGCKVSVFTRVV